MATAWMCPRRTRAQPTATAYRGYEWIGQVMPVPRPRPAAGLPFPGPDPAERRQLSCFRGLPAKIGHWRSSSGRLPAACVRTVLAAAGPASGPAHGRPVWAARCAAPATSRGAGPPAAPEPAASPADLPRRAQNASRADIAEPVRNHRLTPPPAFRAGKVRSPGEKEGYSGRCVEVQGDYG
jgi:hypothetical protein